jgi:hypothetical protein
MLKLNSVAADTQKKYPFRFVVIPRRISWQLFIDFAN